MKDYVCALCGKPATQTKTYGPGQRRWLGLRRGYVHVNATCAEHVSWLHGQVWQINADDGTSRPVYPTSTA